MIFDWLTPTYPTIALPWTPISRLYNAEKFSLFNGGSHFWKAKKVTSNSKKLIFFNAFHFIIPKGRQLRGSQRIDLSIKYSWLALVNTLSKFQLPSSNCLWFMMLWRFGGKGWLTHSLNHKAVCRTAPATPGLLTFSALCLGDTYYLLNFDLFLFWVKSNLWRLFLTGLMWNYLWCQGLTVITATATVLAMCNCLGNLYCLNSPWFVP